MNAFLEYYLTKVREEMDNEKEFGGSDSAMRGS